MNNKRTNYLIAILNIIVVITMILIAIFENDLAATVIYPAKSDQVISLYGCHASEILYENTKFILALVTGILAITNIICAIQNRENKKIFFWQLAFGILMLYTCIQELELLDYDVMEWAGKILIGAVPIILAIINIIKIRKNKPIWFEVVSYIIAIIIAILSFIFSEIIMLNVWKATIIIMQFIHIHKQDSNIYESNSRKIINILLYYVIESLIVILFLGISAISIVNTKVNDAMYKKEIAELLQKVSEMQGAYSTEQYIPVEKNSKYGYINENNKEVIPCEYDGETFFLHEKVNGRECHFALAEKDNKYYIISKTNDKIDISDNKYFKYFKELWNIGFENGKENIVYYTSTYTYTMMSFLAKNSNLNINLYSVEAIENSQNEKNEIDLQEVDDNYYYKHENYTMKIELLEDEEDYTTKAKVTVIKKDGTTSSSIEMIAYLDKDDGTIQTLSNGCIAFENEQGEIKGWYNEYGNKIRVNGEYKILDVKYDKIFMTDSAESVYYILDMSGRVILKTDVLYFYNDNIIIKNKNNKMVICNSELNEVSAEYDKIILGLSFELSS